MRKKSIFFLILLLSSNLSIFFMSIPVAQGADGDEWLTGYDYRKSLQIVNATGAGDGYQVKITVHGGNGTDSGTDVYLNGSGLPDFGDIRFTDGDGETELDYFILEQVNNLGEEAVSNDGRGQYASPYLTRPASWYLNNRTYFVWMDQAWDPNIVYYDHENETFSSPVQVASSPINDDHAYPMMLIDDSGYIHVFYGCHETGLKYRRSSNPEDISSWDVMGDIASGATYPIGVKMANGTLYAFYRKTVVAVSRLTWNFVKSDNGGTTWSPSTTTIIDFGVNKGIYAGGFTVDSTGLIHFMWHYYQSGVARRNLYHAYFNPATGNCSSMNGTNLGPIIDYTEGEAHCKLRTLASLAHFGDIIVDSNDYPLLIQNTVVPDRYSYHWNGTAWNTGNVTFDGTGNGALAYYNDSDIRFFTDVNTGTIRDIREYQTTDLGDTWTLVTNVSLNDSEYNYYPNVPVNFTDEIKIWWTRGATPSDILAYGTVTTPISSATVWVKVADSLEANATIYLYYGNSTATTTSNGETTFPWLFDDFNNYSINDAPNAPDWTYEGVDPGDTIDVQADPADATRKVFRIVEAGDGTNTMLFGELKDNRTGFAINYRVQGNQDGSWYMTALEVLNPIVTIRRSWASDRWETYDGAYKDYVPALACPLNTWQTMEDQVEVADSYHHKVMDGTNALGVWRNVPVTGIDAYRFHMATTASRTMYIGGVGQSDRYIFVRKFNDPEPTLGAWGAEEEAPAGPGPGGNTAPTRGAYILDQFDAPDLLSDGERNNRFWFSATDIDGYDTVDTLEFSIMVGSTWCNFSYDTNADGSGSWTKTTEQPYVEMFNDGWGGATSNYMMYAWIQANPGAPDTYNVEVYQRITDTSSASSGWGQIYGTPFNIVESGDDPGSSGSSSSSNGDGGDDDGTPPEGPGDPDWWMDPDNLNDMSEDDLAVLADSLGIDVDDSDTKADIIADILALAEEDGFTPFEGCGLDDEEKLGLLEYLLSLSVQELRLECQDLGISYKLWRDPEPYIILIFTVGYRCTPPDEFYERGFFDPEDWDADGVPNWDDPDMFDETRIGLGARVEDINISTSIPWIQQNGYLVIILALFLAFMYSQVKKSDQPGSRGESLIRPKGKGYLPGERT